MSLSTTVARCHPAVRYRMRPFEIAWCTHHVHAVPFAFLEIHERLRLPIPTRGKQEGKRTKWRGGRGCVPTQPQTFTRFQYVIKCTGIHRKCVMGSCSICHLCRRIPQSHKVHDAKNQGERGVDKGAGLSSTVLSNRLKLALPEDKLQYLM